MQNLQVRADSKISVRCRDFAQDIAPDYAWLTLVDETCVALSHTRMEAMDVAKPWIADRASLIDSKA